MKSRQYSMFTESICKLIDEKIFLELETGIYTNPEIVRAKELKKSLDRLNLDTHSNLKDNISRWLSSKKETWIKQKTRLDEVNMLLDATISEAREMSDCTYNIAKDIFK